jgi:hypothetical protein
MALPASGIWECRVSGNDANGGSYDPGVTSPGTDYSVQDSAQVSYTDLVIGATTTQLTSSATPFTSAHVGNTIQVASGTGFTAGWYSVRSVASGVATMDRAVGTAASTGGVGKLGGALATPGMLAKALSAGTSGMIGFLKYSATPYQCSASGNVAGGFMQITVSKTAVWGYDATRAVGNTDANRPTMQPTANGMNVFAPFGTSNVTLGQVILDANGHTGVNGVSSSARAHIIRVKATGLQNGIALTGNGTVEECEAVSCTTAGISLSGNGGTVARSAATGCTGSGIYMAVDGTVAVDCHAIGTAGAGFNLAAAGTTARNCTARGSTGASGDGFLLNQGEGLLVGCRAWSCSRYGFNLPTAETSSRLVHCAAGNCTSGVTNSAWAAYQLENFVTLTADPDTNAAGGDYSPNAAAGGGALVRGVAFAYPGTSTTSYRDIGAAQSAAAGASGGLRTIGLNGGF